MPHASVPSTKSPAGNGSIRYYWFVVLVSIIIGVVTIGFPMFGPSDSLPLERTLIGHQGSVSCMAWSPDGLTLATGCEEGTVKLWNVSTGNERGILIGHTKNVAAVSFSPDSSLLASASTKWFSGSRMQTMRRYGPARVRACGV